MANVYASIVCRHRWWLKYYLASVLFACRLTGRDPHLGRVTRWIERGIVVEVL
ncbi:hypothetical protein [Pseudomonas fulva]|uniref:hypothetical protein n=1 Tax=Pseudomonas fulva TaxID=47880 RepID=UPI0015F3A9A9|nr:hypothetical protein [Pseudomonas fulva]